MVSGLEQYLAPGTCAKCGGKCCQRLPGEAKPGDIVRLFGDDLQRALVAAFCTGNWVIDWWEGDPRGLEYDDPHAIDCGYYIRPRVLTDTQGKLYNGSWGGECIFWTPEGCTLAPEERPWGCRVLEPKSGDGSECISHGSGKNEAAMAWIDLHETIKDAAQIAITIGVP